MAAFNSLAYSNELVSAGVSRAQADVHANVLHRVYDDNHQQYATTNDFNDLKVQLQLIEVAVRKLTTSINSLVISQKFIIWICGTLAALCVGTMGIGIPVVFHSIK